MQLPHSCLCPLCYLFKQFLPCLISEFWQLAPCRQVCFLFFNNGCNSALWDFLYSFFQFDSNLFSCRTLSERSSVSLRCLFGHAPWWRYTIWDVSQKMYKTKMIEHSDLFQDKTHMVQNCFSHTFIIKYS